jgi:hypothetical protein
MTKNTQISKSEDVVANLIGKPYVFVIIEFESEKKNALFALIKRTAEDRRIGLQCIRGDNIGHAGKDLLTKVHELIYNAEVVIADISTSRQNVFYEVGYANGVKKSPILLKDNSRNSIQDKSTESDVPTDLRGLETINYDLDRDPEDLARKLISHINSRLEKQLIQLRDMLEADEKFPNYIMTLPKPPNLGGPARAGIYRNRTDGDYLGILRLTSAFGSLWGFYSPTEIISPNHCDQNIAKLKGNIFSIGSSKTNKITKRVLDAINRENDVNWSFEPQTNLKKPTGSHKVLTKIVKSVRTEYPAINSRIGDKKILVPSKDYGLIIRYPRHDFTNEHLITILAGARSLGTGTACVAATNPEVIKIIRQRIFNTYGADLITEKNIGFWVLLSGSSNNEDMHLSYDTIKVIDCDIFSKFRTSVLKK